MAGYDGLMDEFIHSNPGLESRFNRYLHFDDYSIDEMMSDTGFAAEEGTIPAGRRGAQPLCAIISSSANTGSIAFGNARGVRNIFERLLRGAGQPPVHRGSARRGID